ncbi:hypothetical protein ACIBCO_41430 [Streptomyces violascens]|uniref:hypothetical protein n=1 Tax=Streptomyces violascens TaxID=67381 RepID=UPI0037A2C438
MAAQFPDTEVTHRIEGYIEQVSAVFAQQDQGRLDRQVAAAFLLSGIIATVSQMPEVPDSELRVHLTRTGERVLGLAA